MVDRFDDAVEALWPATAGYSSLTSFRDVASLLRGSVVADLSATTCPYAFWSATTEIGPTFLTFSMERIIDAKRCAFYLVGAAEMPLIARWTEEPVS